MFPNVSHVALLHGICAVASLYTPFGEKNISEKASASDESGFGMAHAQWCSMAFYTGIQTGDRLYELLQCEATRHTGLIATLL